MTAGSALASWLQEPGRGETYCHRHCYSQDPVGTERRRAVRSAGRAHGAPPTPCPCRPLPASPARCPSSAGLGGPCRGRGAGRAGGTASHLRPRAALCRPEPQGGARGAVWTHLHREEGQPPSSPAPSRTGAVALGAPGARTSPLCPACLPEVSHRSEGDRLGQATVSPRANTGETGGGSRARPTGPGLLRRPAGRGGGPRVGGGE